MTLVLTILVLAAAAVFGIGMALAAVIEIHIVVVPAPEPPRATPVVGARLAAARARRGQGWERCSPFTGVLLPPITTPPPPADVLAEFLAVRPEPYVPPATKPARYHRLHSVRWGTPPAAPQEAAVA